MGRIVLAFLVVLPGVAGVVVFGAYALIDWEALMKTDAAFETASVFSVIFAWVGQPHRLRHLSL